MCADFTSNGRDKIRAFRYTTNFPNSDTNEDRVNNLLSMILEMNTSFVLSTLEEHRQKLSEAAFQSLILLLTTEFNNSTWKERIHQQTMQVIARAPRRQCSTQQLAIKVHIDRCSLIVLYYIVSVIHKYKIAEADPIWTQIFNNSITKTITFYRFLYKNKIIIPDTICTVFSKTLLSFYNFGSVKDNIILILLGFTIDMTKLPYVRIKDYEKLLSGLKRHDLFNKNLNPQQFMYPQMTPEELSLFLSYFSDYDLNTINPNMNYNILDQIINMKPHFYIAPEDKNHASHFMLDRIIRPRNIDTLKLSSYPNEITKYRAARILNLFQSVILNGAQVRMF